ncbi:putative bifunctional diguanylate cyclase/phosphodiesterase [Nitrincola schmidtii]|uniref:putative bifunctional diguanylate cyclase/phosphodiesterase n=1 Tax=Nitrincola schmidtii TaxID=1730894 RepID=UPI00124E6674|nr:GGDEF domain-containing phosphodiesterase [Nitrincola schmidtii]
MRAGKTVLLMFLLPAFAVLVFSFGIGLLSLKSLKSQYLINSDVQASDLLTLHQESTFKRDISELHQRVSDTLDSARKGALSDIGLYRLHAHLVDDLAAIEQQVEVLAASNLLREVNHDSVNGLRQSFTEYRRLVIMATEIAAIDPNTANTFFAEAQTSFNQFSIFSGRIAMLLTERTMQREKEARQRHEEAFVQIFVFSLLGAALIFVAVLIIAIRISGHVRDIADALSELSYNSQSDIHLPKMERLQVSSSGEFGRIANVILGFRDDMVRRIKAEEENHRLIFYDALTELPNRRFLQEQLQYAVGTGARVNNFHALLWLDLDRFKVINDVRGHQAGDHLLIEVTKHLNQMLREGDLLARVGGDEFAIFFELPQKQQSEAAKEAERIALRICAGLSREYFIDGHGHFMTASMGIVLFSDRHIGVETLLSQAEVAKYQAKDTGPGTVSFYDPNIQAEINRVAELESELRSALDLEQLILHYQLQFDEHSKPVGAEILMRWQHPEKGLISPLDFIPLAEESGLIVPIGKWVIESACKLLSNWQFNPSLRHMQLAVNVSAKQFRQENFVEMVLSIIEQTGAPADKLKLELTESILLENVEKAIRKMKALRAKGITFAMDDFGTGYSSLQYLKRLPLDQIKIDQSFVRDIVDDPEDTVIIQTIIAMGQALSIEVIAEGVETEEQLSLLSAYGCHRYQGYLFTKPVSLSDCLSLIKRFNNKT